MGRASQPTRLRGRDPGCQPRARSLTFALVADLERDSVVADLEREEDLDVR